MVDVVISLNKKRECSRVSKLIHYPDGVSRILAMKRYEWDWVATAEKHGYPFNDVLGGAQTLAVEFPSGNGYQYDVLSCTQYMLRTIIGGLHEKKYGVAN